MLATLNLQLSPVELLDDHALTPLSPASGESGEEASGFADLLRLRVDAALMADTTSGELLPEGGSELPIITELAPTEALTELLTAPGVDVSLVKLAPSQSDITLEQEGTLLVDEAADIILESPVLYPPTSAGTDAEPEALPLTAIPSSALLQATPSSQPAKTDIGAESRHDAALERPLNLNIGPKLPVPPPVIDGREVRAQNPGAEATVLATAGLSLRERGEQGERSSRAAPITVPTSALDADKQTALTDFARRLDLAPGQRTEPVADGLQHRFNLAQAAQNLQAPTSPQPAQSALSLSPAAATTSAELNYTAAAQQSTDLIGTSVRDSAWGEKLGERVVMMASNHLKQAEIRLTPAELGPLRVQLSVDDGNTNVTFHAQHAVTREALEQALPRLREMLAENGLSLGQADVSDRGVADGGRDQESADGAVGPASDDAGELELESTGGDPSRRATTSNGLLDTFV